MASVAAAAAVAIIEPTRDASEAAQGSAEADRAAEEREQAKDDEKLERAAGAPVEIVPGLDGDGSTAPLDSFLYSFPEPTESIDGVAADFRSEDFLTDEYFDWLDGNDAVQVEVASSRFTIKAVHETTVVVQGMRVVDLECGPATDGTLVLAPGMGGPGQLVERTRVAFDLAETPRPVAREVLLADTDWVLGEEFFSRSLYLEGGEVEDRRTLDVYFLTRNQDCEFGLEILVTGGDEEVWLPVELRPGVDRLTVAGMADPYQTVVGWESGGGLKILPADTPWHGGPNKVWGTGRDPDEPPPPFEPWDDPHDG